MVELFCVVFIVDIVANAYELSSVVGTCEKNDSDAQDFGGWEAGKIGRIGFEDELVDSDWDRADKESVELLVMFS